MTFLTLTLTSIYPNLTLTLSSLKNLPNPDPNHDRPTRKKCSRNTAKIEQRKGITLVWARYYVRSQGYHRLKSRCWQVENLSRLIRTHTNWSRCTMNSRFWYACAYVHYVHWSGVLELGWAHAAGGSHVHSEERSRHSGRLRVLPPQARPGGSGVFFVSAGGLPLGIAVGTCRGEGRAGHAPAKPAKQILSGMYICEDQTQTPPLLMQ